MHEYKDPHGLRGPQSSRAFIFVSYTASTRWVALKFPGGGTYSYIDPHTQVVAQRMFGYI